MRQEKKRKTGRKKTEHTYSKAASKLEHAVLDDYCSEESSKNPSQLVRSTSIHMYLIDDASGRVASTIPIECGDIHISRYKSVS